MEEFLKTIQQDKEVNEFISQLSKDEIETNICLFLEQVKANKVCNQCKGKKECLSDVINMQSHLVKNTSIVSREYYPCSYKTAVDDDLFEILYIPSKFIDNNELYVDGNRFAILQEIKKIKDGTENKGFYLYGPFGTGKTYLMLSLGKFMSTKGMKVIVAYYPELVRKAKSSIADNSLEKLINKLKNVDVLMLDDIGGELNTAFIRDEFLGPILQYRMMMNLPVYMTSNYDFKELEKHFVESKDVDDPMKASRIMERIEFLMKPIKLGGNNYRR